tara:strand:- start:615 stop:2219 length:1605 start_codon:yes stop_codon:yes gene_type:complete
MSQQKAADTPPVSFCVFTGSADIAVPGMFNPLLAYPREVLDPGADGSRDEGEARLKLLRPVLHMAAKESPGLNADTGTASFTASMVKEAAQRPGVHAAFFKVDAPWKPAVRLAALSTITFAPEVADSTVDEESRVSLIPVKGTNDVAVLNVPRESVPAPKLVITVPRKYAGSADAHVECRRISAGAMRAVVFSGGGARNESVMGGVEPQLLDRLFAQSLPSRSRARLLPTLPGELPLEIASPVADFWQRQKRCHCISAALAPEGSTRPLAFESITVAGVPADRPDRVVVRAKLHPSSIKCACPLHGLAPIKDRFPSERFTGESEVELTLSMCGRKRSRLADGSYTDCSLHGAGTADVGLVQGICCNDTVATLGCSHITGVAGKKRTGRKSGLWMPNLALSGLDVLHAQVLIASAWQCHARVEPLLGKRPRDEVALACEGAFNAMARRLAEVDRRRALLKHTVSDVEMIARDIAVVDMLRAKDVRRHVRPSSKEEVLARVKPDGEASPLTGDEAKLAETHLGLFPKPRGGGKGRR